MSRKPKKPRKSSAPAESDALTLALAARINTPLPGDPPAPPDDIEIVTAPMGEAAPQSRTMTELMATYDRSKPRSR